MPRRNSAVKGKSHSDFTSLGAVDLHFHGAFGIDLMTADERQLDELSRRLWRAGVAAFCPTTLSAGPKELLAAVTRLGRWIRKGRAPGAIPLGIHLEGPFIDPGSCGAHPSRLIRKLTFSELDRLWEASGGTLKILTIAPERLSGGELKRLGRWARSRKVVLSLGHSHATEVQARSAIEAGFRGVTHAWNASGFHHRSPGPLGAAIGNPKVYLELIIDGVHVAPAVIRWTRAAHPDSKICFVSDCVPSAATRSGWHRFGSLKVRYGDGASRLPNGALAGGGLLLPESFARWAAQEARSQGIPLARIARAAVASLSENPLRALGISASKLARKKVRWRIAKDQKLQVIPVDSAV